MTALQAIPEPFDLSGFETWLRSWGASERTVEVRVKIIRAAIRSWGADPTLVTTAQLTEWIASPAFSNAWTRAAYFTHLRSLCEWMRKTGLRPDDPTLDMRRPAKPRGKPRPLEDAEVERVLAAATGRYRAWVLLGLYAGMRAHEVAKIRGEDVSQRAIYVLGKGRKPASIPTHPEIWALAQEYPRKGWWFPSASPAHEGMPLAARTVTIYMSKFFDTLDIDGGHHRLRHTYGTRLLRAGVNIRVVQELMRHESLQTTAAYTAVDEDEMMAGVLSLR